MALRDDESVFSDAPSIRSNPFTIAARSTASSFAPHRNTRHRATRVPLLRTKKLTHLQRPRFSPQQNSNHGSLQEIPRIETIQEQENDGLFVAEKRLENKLEENENQESFKCWRTRLALH